MNQAVQRQTQQTIYKPVKEKKVKHLVRKGGITKGEKLIYASTLLVVVFALYLVISNYATIYMTNHQIQQSEYEIQQQLSVNDGLTLQVMEMSDPDVILSRAKEMGMTLDDGNVKFAHPTN
ncbi:septum formation initiator family protein [Evansella sp. AB-P1]|uniref:cell division protein FtsL n=1 Tax=Evansella sp. AB-P1 TaxID=3037653 RepID=UPI00241EA349|nr:septum formation initiator family protein [Evansella sp. AB-P1]MDG5788295.1 septum formation initiator family protein [Evansella sp. AB-P1]